MNFDNCVQFLIQVIKSIYAISGSKIKVNCGNIAQLNMEFKKKIKNISEKFNIILLVDELEHLLNKDKKNFE